MPMLIIQRAEPEGVATKGEQVGQDRDACRWPTRALPIIRGLRRAENRDHLLCVTATGHQLHTTALKRTLVRQT